MATIRSKHRDKDSNIPIYAMRTTEVQINNSNSMPSSAFGLGRVVLENPHAYPGSGANAYRVVPVLSRNAEPLKR